LDIKLEEAAAIANAEEIGIEQAKPFLAAHMPLKHKGLKARRAVLKSPFQEFNTEFVLKAVVNDHGRWLSQQQLFLRFKNPTKTNP